MAHADAGRTSIRASFLWFHQIWQGFFSNEAASIPGVKVVTTTAHGLPHETTTRGKQPDALITVPQPPGPSFTLSAGGARNTPVTRTRSTGPTAPR
jgi:hypothetical protein